MISRLLMGLMVLSISMSGFAETRMDPAPNLNPVYSDVSVAYLANTFGVVDGVLHGSGSQILGHMFKMFNNILFAFAGLLWAYTSFIGILNTASQGQFLGQRWSSMWVPFRIVAGAVLLLPKAGTGYSMIQIIVMYIVLQGVGAANQVWGTALDYLQKSGTIVEFAQPLRPKKGLHAAQQASQVANHELLIDEAGKILKAEVAMLTLYNAREKKGRSLGLSPLPHFAQTVQTSQKIGQTGRSRIAFPGPFYGRNAIQGSCGEVSWQDTHADELTSCGVKLMVQSLLPVAQSIADQIVPVPPMKSSVVKSPETIDESQNDQVRCVSSNPPQHTQHNPLLPFAGNLIHAANDCWAFMKRELRQQQHKDKQQANAQFETMKAQGWILAGSYYYQLAKFNQIHHDNADLTIPHDKIRATFSLAKVNSELDEVTKKALDNAMKAIDEYTQREKQSAFKAGYYNPEAPPQTQSNESDWRDSFFRPFQKNIRQFQHQMEATMQAQIDPIMALAKIGNSLVKVIQNSWEEMTRDGRSFQEKFVQKDALFIPLVGIWATLNFTVGATLLYYIPLMPFLLFFFGSLTWFAFVIEAMVAAPLIALGTTHPEGHDFFGKAEQAVMLLASIFLRPMLMIFGFILGMIFCTIAFNLFHYGYHIAIEAVVSIEGDDWLQIVTHTTMMVIYTTTALSIVNRCFAMIYEIPNRALRWMGGPTEGHNDAEGAMQVKGAVERYAGQASGSVGQGNQPSSPPPNQVTASR